MSDQSITFNMDFTIEKRKIGDVKTIPIIINNYNRLNYLDKMLKSLNYHGYCNIYIIDNKSFYKPLLRYYDQKSLRVFQLEENVGYKALWETEIYKFFINDYYVYSDPDILPDSNCPSDFLSRFMDFLNRFPNLDKVGFGLRIDDLPDHFRIKSEVIQHESQFWETKICDGLLKAPVDTTFALYRPGAKGIARNTNGARTDFPYVAQHLPWYIDHSNLSNEDRCYLNCHKIHTHWSAHPSNFSFFKKYYLLFKTDKIPIIWKMRRTGRKFLDILSLKNKS